MISRIVYFVLYAVLIFLAAWVFTVILDIFPVIPGTIKEVLHTVIWIVAFICVVLLGLRMFAGMLPSPPEI